MRPTLNATTDIRLRARERTGTDATRPPRMATLRGWLTSPQCAGAANAVKIERADQGDEGRYASLLVLGWSLAALAGCTSADGHNESSSPTPLSSAGDDVSANPTPEPADSPAYVDAESPLVQRLWRPVGSLPLLRTGLPRRLDTAEIESAPSLSDAPLASAVIAVGTDPAPYHVGGVAVMSPEGAWRIVDRQRIGMRRTDDIEQPYLLSPDGRTLALGDEYGLVCWTSPRPPPCESRSMPAMLCSIGGRQMVHS